jgi:tetratricopeptide (TPR) repeat protein
MNDSQLPDEPSHYDTDTSHMLETSGSQQQDRLRAFFQQAPETAVAYRLALARREMRNYQFLEREFDLLWDAARRCYEQQEWERLVDFRETLQPFLDVHGFWEHSLTLNQWAIEAARVLGNGLDEARWRHDCADMLNQQGRYREAELFYQASETLYRRLDQDEWALKSRHMRSLVVRAQGRTAEAHQLCQSTIAEARTLQLGSWLAHPLYVLALFARDRGHLKQAAALVEESIDLLSGTREDAMLGQCHTFLGELALRQKEVSRARTHLEAGLKLVRGTSTLRLVLSAQRLMGDLALAERHYSEAADIYDEILSIFASRRLGDKLVLAKTLASRARLMIQTKQPQEAVQDLEAALSLFQEVGNARRAVDTSSLLIGLYLRQGRLLQAAKQLLPTLKVAYSSDLVHPRTIFTWLRLHFTH